MAHDSRPLTWRKSTASAQGNCVEVAMAEESVLLRDTKNRQGAVLAFSPAEWQAFIVGVKGNEFELHRLREER